MVLPAQLLMGRIPRSLLISSDQISHMSQQRTRATEVLLRPAFSYSHSLDINQPVFIKNFGHGAKQTPWIQGTVKEIVRSQN